jgi:hypothetical protein
LNLHSKFTEHSCIQPKGLFEKSALSKGSSINSTSNVMKEFKDDAWNHTVLKKKGFESDILVKRLPKSEKGGIFSTQTMRSPPTEKIPIQNQKCASHSNSVYTPASSSPLLDKVNKLHNIANILKLRQENQSTAELKPKVALAEATPFSELASTEPKPFQEITQKRKLLQTWSKMYGIKEIEMELVEILNRPPAPRPGCI